MFQFCPNNPPEYPDFWNMGTSKYWPYLSAGKPQFYLPYNDQTNNLVLSETVYIEMYTQLHSATRVVNNLALLSLFYCYITTAIVLVLCFYFIQVHDG